MEYTIKDLQKWDEVIGNIVLESGLDVYEQEFELISYKDMLDYEAYTGMPSRYPHWSFGKAYEKNRTYYQYNLTGLPYEMVINSDPCLAYLMKENTLLLQILTIAHVYGHNDFFKNNRLFTEGTEAKNTIEMFKGNADRVRRLMNDPSIGYQGTEVILNAAHSIKLQVSRTVGEKRLSEEDQKKQLQEEYIESIQNYNSLEPYNKPAPPDISKTPLKPEEDLLYFIARYGDLEEWERALIETVRKEAMYFIPQIETKIMNEGWASYWHYNILKQLKLTQEHYLEFLQRHNAVIAPISMSINPYYLGFKIFEDIEKRFGREKLFEARAIERDESFLRRYLTLELCQSMNMFDYAKKGSDYFIQDVSDDKGWMNIRNVLCNTCGMNNVPTIRVVEMSKQDKSLILEHVFDGRELLETYCEATLKHIFDLWKHPVRLFTKINGDMVCISCNYDRNISIE